MTRRQKIIKFIRAEPLSLEDLSKLLRVHFKVVLDDIPHVEKSVQPKEELIITAAKCLQCGFTFKERRKFTTPSRCPKCKATRITDPLFQVKER